MQNLRTRLSRFAVLFLSVAASVLVLASPAALGAGAYTYVTAPDNSGSGWWNVDPGADTRSGGTANIVAGPGGPGAVGTGSLRMTSDSSLPGGASAAKAQFVTYSFVGTRLSDISGMSYADYRASTSTTNSGQRISLNLQVDFIGDGTSFTTLVFEPIYQSGGAGALVSDQWQAWDAFKGGNAIWWSTKPIPGVCDFNCFVSWNTILANNPNAKIKYLVGFNIGSGWTGQFTGYADGLTLRTPAGSEIYNFETVAPPVTTTALTVRPSLVNTPTLFFDSRHVVGVGPDSAPGFGVGAFASDGVAKTDLYIAPTELFGRDVPVGEVKSFSFWTKKGTTHAADLNDWYVNLYTKPYPGQLTGTGFYGVRLNSQPYLSENISEAANTWNLWSSAGPTNWLRMCESTYGYFGSNTDPHLADFVGGVSLPGARGSGVPYGIQPILFFSPQTASGTAGFTGRIDGFRVELMNGSVATVNFERDQTLGKPGDFDGDNKQDIVFRHTDGRVAIWTMNGLTTTTSAQIFPAGTAWTVARQADTDGDGKSDLVWQNPDGRVAVYQMNGTTATTKTNLLPAGGWQVKHAGDLDGDGRADIVFQHSDGTTAAYLMNGGTIVQGGTLLGAGSGWSVTKTGDFDGDGRMDLVWTHTDGSVAIWLMNGLTATSMAQVMNAGSGWSVAHVADMDGDGKADLVWQHTDGRVAVWLMNGTTMTSGAEVLAAGSGFVVARTGDFNGDGKADLLFTHSDGRMAIWLMNGLTVTTSTQLLNAGAGWSVVNVIDLDGDGKSDILFEHTDGRIAAWLMNGTTVSSGGDLLGAGSGWHVLAP
ncbi:hypothetical protein BWI17_13065 [Betaproteobacteria bacterium GR16-43]|nr:hypothetical protein BWI17_13065 [Betaproteobacteria bacterium GR16-43]